MHRCSTRSQFVFEKRRRTDGRIRLTEVGLEVRRATVSLRKNPGDARDAQIETLRDGGGAQGEEAIGTATQNEDRSQSYLQTINHKTINGLIIRP